MAIGKLYFKTEPSNHHFKLPKGRKNRLLNTASLTHVRFCLLKRGPKLNTGLGNLPGWKKAGDAFGLPSVATQVPFSLRW